MFKETKEGQTHSYCTIHKSGECCCCHETVGCSWAQAQRHFTYDYISELDEVREHIRKCEGKHTQQVVYSTFHDSLTQICFGCWKVRTMVNQ